jgi:hypothetical protein
VETYWLHGPKSNYTSAMDTNVSTVRDDEPIMFDHQVKTTQETTVPSNSMNKPSDDHLKVVQTLPNVINRSVSTSAGQCPFSGR